MDEEQQKSRKFNFMQKTKLNWFSSLRRKHTKKESCSLQLNDTNKDDGKSLEDNQDNFLNAHNNNNNNNNNSTNNNYEEQEHSSNENLRNKNIFQRIKFKMDFKSNNASGAAAIRSNSSQNNEVDEVDMIKCENNGRFQQNSFTVFTHNYREKIAKKWLEQNNEPNLFMYHTCMELIDHVWYWGETSRQHAQNQLTGKPNGSFLVRDSESGGALFTLSFRINNCTFHYRLQYFNNYWHCNELQYESIVELIDDIQLKSADSSFICFVKTNIMAPPIPVFLRYPISRYIEIPKLQELCKRSLIQYLQENNTSDKIEKLPIPVKLQEFLMEKSSFIF